MAQSVGIVTINLNQKELVEQFVEEIRKQTFTNYQFYVVDNGSAESQKVSESVSRESWITVIENGANLGFTGGNNVGIGQALKDGHEFVWIVNNDVKLDPDCLLHLVGYLSAHPEVGIVGPKIYYVHNPKLIWYAGGRINWGRPFPYTVNTHIGERVVDEGQFENTIKTDFVTGASMLVRRRALYDAVQLRTVLGHDQEPFFDTRYFVYFEDADLSKYVQKAGYQTVYLPQAKMWHMVGAFSGVNSPRSSYYQIRNSLLFVTRWAPWWSKLLAYLNMLVILAKNLVKLFLKSKRKFAVAQLRAVKDFVLGHFGGPVEIEN